MKEVYKEKLLEYGIKQGINDFYVELATKLAEQYCQYFCIQKFQYIFYGIINTNEKTRLPYYKLKTFTPEEVDYLYFEDTEIFYIKPSLYSYIRINLKNEVLNLVIDNKEVFLKKVFTLEEIILYLKKQNKYIDSEEIENYQEKLYLKSLIYNYAYCIIEENSTLDEEYARAGMFKNAYYDIMNIYNNSLSKNLNR